MAETTPRGETPALFNVPTAQLQRGAAQEQVIADVHAPDDRDPNLLRQLDWHDVSDLIRNRLRTEVNACDKSGASETIDPSTIDPFT